MLDQFVKLIKHLKVLKMCGWQESGMVPEADRLNMLEVFSRFIEEQEEPIMQVLCFYGISSQ